MLRLTRNKTNCP